MPADPVLPHYRITHLPHHHCTQQPASFLLTTQPLPLYNLTLPSLKWKEMYPWQYKPIFCIKCTSILYNRYEVYSKTNATVTIAAPTFIWDIGLLKTLFRSVYDQKKLWRRLFPSDQLIGARLACTHPTSSTPPWQHYDRCQKFRRRAATARKSFDEIKETADLTFGDKSFHKFTIYCIINKVKAGKITDD